MVRGMAKYRHELCARCRKVWADRNSAYCLSCLATHPDWVPDLGCGDLGCYLSHAPAPPSSTLTSRSDSATVPTMFTFTPSVKVKPILSQLKATAEQIESEPMLFHADWRFADKHGGPLTRRFLSGILTHLIGGSERYVSIDSRSHMLMPGWFPAIPGWHHDSVERSPLHGQPLYDSEGPLGLHSEHYMMVIDATDQPTGAMTEFIADKVSVPNPYNQSSLPVYGLWDNYINTFLPHATKFTVDSGLLYFFDNTQFHRAMPAVNNGWRWFIRATVSLKPAHDSKIRRNANVYLPEPGRGW